MFKRLNQIWLRKKLKLKEYDFLFDDQLETKELVCFDCETSGLNPKKDHLVSLSAIKIRGKEILTSETLNLTFKQPAELNPESILVHGIRNIDLAQGMEPQEAIEKFVNFIGARPLVGYYLEFDIAMVNNLIKPWLGIGLPNQQIEVSELYYKKFISSHRLKSTQPMDLSFSAILKKLDIPSLNQHNAFNDALMTALMYVKLQES